MRKLFWYCVATAVLAAVGVYLAADYVDRNPNYFISYKGIVTGDTTLCHGPMAVASAEAVERTFEQIQQAMADPQVAPHALPESEPPVELALTPRTLGRIVIEPGEEPATVGGDRLCPVPAEKAGVGEEAEVVSTPICTDDVQVPAYMPHADEVVPDVGKAVFDTFWGVLRNAAQRCAENGFPPDCRVDPNEVYQYPGCPSAHSYQHPPCCPYTGKSVGNGPIGVVPHCEYGEESELHESELAVPATAPPKNDSGKRGDERTPRKGLDTMELRKTDLRYKADYIPY
jgi:hypothetical protein